VNDDEQGKKLNHRDRWEILVLALEAIARVILTAVK